MRSLVGSLVVASCLALGACGGSDGPDESPTPAPSTEAPDTSTPGAGPSADPDPDPTLTGKPPGGSQQLTGRVESGVEARCLVLTVGGGSSYVLTGTVAGLEPGDRVTVKGRADPGAATTCQQGPVFVVAEIVTG